MPHAPPTGPTGPQTARIGVDVGGTFTDVVLARDDGRLFVNKTTTTKQDPCEGALAGIIAVLEAADLPAGAITEIVHGTTIASNTILQKAGARTGLLTNAGFRDVLEIGRIRTPGMFDLSWHKPDPLVPRRWRLEIAGRMGPDGQEITPLDEPAIIAAAGQFLAEHIQAVAICFLHSYANPVHERRALALLAQHAPSLLLTASCDVLPEIKEYERTSTAVVNAYLLPAMRVYLARLSQLLEAAGIAAPVQVMASNGGMIGLESASRRPVFVVGSGPAGGVTGAAMLAAQLSPSSGKDLPAGDDKDLIVFDMGGTTAKAAIITDGQPALVGEYEFRDGITTPSRFTKGGGFTLKVPAIDIAEIGSGGGSIARIDAGGLLVVGPQSAGGDPGPACYGRGNTQPTVTDANMVLGLLNPVALAGGSLKVQPELSAEAILRHIAQPLGIGLHRAALGIRAVANAGMARAIRAVTIERGRDPRDAALLAFGGGGPLHAVDVAAILDIKRVIISPVAGVFSAAGMLAADVTHDFLRAVLAPLDQVADATINRITQALAAEGRAALAREGHAASAVQLRFGADLRYLGQSSELTVHLPWPFTAAARVPLAEAFHRLYAETFGYRADEKLELVNLRLSAIGTTPMRLDFANLGAEQTTAAPLRETTRPVCLDPDLPPLAARVLGRAALQAGPIAGPAIIESYDTTILVPPGHVAHAGAAGCVIMERETPHG